MSKLHSSLMLSLPLALGLAACGPIVEESAHQTSVDEHIDPATGDIIQTAHWEYPDGDRVTTTQRIPATADNERRRGPPAPPPHLAFVP